VKRAFEIIDRPEEGGHRYSVLIDNRDLWMNNNPLSTTDEKLRLFRELLAWLQADGDMDVSLKERKP
jgi:hypothetical protein